MGTTRNTTATKIAEFLNCPLQDIAEDNKEFSLDYVPVMQEPNLPYINNMTDKIKYLERIIIEKDERIKLLQEIIDELKIKLSK